MSTPVFIRDENTSSLRHDGATAERSSPAYIFFRQTPSAAAAAALRRVSPSLTFSQFSLLRLLILQFRHIGFFQTPIAFSADFITPILAYFLRLMSAVCRFSPYSPGLLRHLHRYSSSSFFDTSSLSSFLLSDYSRH